MCGRAHAHTCKTHGGGREGQCSSLEGTRGQQATGSKADGWTLFSPAGGVTSSCHPPDAWGLVTGFFQVLLSFRVYLEGPQGQAGVPSPNPLSLPSSAYEIKAVVVKVLFCPGPPSSFQCQQ